MGIWQTSIWFLASLEFFCFGQQVSFCEFDMGKLHRNRFSISAQEEQKAYAKLRDMRSVIECSSHCYTNTTCRTAIYQLSGNCLLFAKYLEDLNLTTSQAIFNTVGSIVVQLRTRRYRKTSSGFWELIACPRECPGNSLCLLNCAETEEEQEPMCMSVEEPTLPVSVTSPYKMTRYVQSKEYYLKELKEDTPEYQHTFFTVRFHKLKNETLLRVKWRGTLRSGMSYAANTTSWWAITFNGSDACELESLHYNRIITPHRVNHHKASGIHGICEDVPAGTANISLTIFSTTSDHDTPLSYIGYGTKGSRLYIDEVEVTESPAVSLDDRSNLPSLFNMKQHTSSLQWNSDASYHGNQRLWTVSYNKTFDETSLKVNLNFVHGVDLVDNTHICVSWYVMINGVQCQPVPISKLIAHFSNGGNIPGEHRSVEIEGYCEGIPAGPVELSLHTDECPRKAGSFPFRFTTGLLSANQRFIIEEFMPGTSVAVITEPTSGKPYWLPYFNIANHGQVGPDSGVDIGLVWTMPDYYKLYGSSGVRISLSADSRILSEGAYRHCCRHYIKINNEECDNPGPISGVSYMSNSANVHKPIIMEGICEGIPSGEVKFALYAGYCHECSNVGSCWFGYDSSVHFMVLESFVDREIQE